VLVLSGNVAAVLAASKNNSGAGYFNLLFIVVLVMGAYLLFIRPAKSRQRKAMETRSNVVPGVEVVTTAGLIATVVEADDETVTLEIAPGVHSRFLKQAIVRVVVPEPPDSGDYAAPPGQHEQIDPDTTDETPPASAG
jgi:preprotein translocase subunit YajC